MSDVLKELMKDEFDKREQETTVNHIRAAMKSFNVNVERAMDIIEIPQSQRPIYAALV